MITKFIGQLTPPLWSGSATGVLGVAIQRAGVFLNSTSRIEYCGTVDSRICQLQLILFRIVTASMSSIWSLSTYPFNLNKLISSTSSGISSALQSQIYYSFSLTMNHFFGNLPWTRFLSHLRAAQISSSRNLRKICNFSGKSDRGSWESMEGLLPCSANLVPLSPINFLERAANVCGDRTSVVFGSLKYNWGQTHQRCLKMASALNQLGISRGDVVSLLH